MDLKPALKVPLLFSVLILSGCITTLSAPGTANGVTGVTPSLAVPDAGWHPQVSLSGSALKGDGTSEKGGAATVEGGLLWQPELKSDWPWGGFASIQGRLMTSQIQMSPSEAEGSLTAEQSQTLSAQGMDFDTAGALRAGLVTKLYIGTISIYYQAVAQYETGSHFDQRRAADGIGRYFNFSSEPWSWGVGPGVDVAIGSAGKWSLGASIDLIGMRNRTQTYIDTENDGSFSEPEVDVTRADGKPYGSYMATGRVYFDYQNYRVFLSVGSTDGGASRTLGFSYRW